MKKTIKFDIHVVLLAFVATFVSKMFLKTSLPFVKFSRHDIAVKLPVVIITTITHYL